MTTTQYRTGLYQTGNHHLCHGKYSFAQCHCPCHACPTCGQRRPT